MEVGFDAGVRDGGLKKGYEVNILVCFLLSSVPDGLSMEELSEACTTQELANYFEVSNSVSELLKLEHITEREHMYQITDKGKTYAEHLINDLPLSVRTRAFETTMKILAKKERSKENETELIKVDDGYKLILRILDNDTTNLMELTLSLPNKEIANHIRANFLNYPLNTYKGILSLLTKDYDALKELYLSPDEDLFTPDNV